MTNQDVLIFLSYAHDDDLALSGLKDEEGFVSYLQKLLELKLRDIGAQRVKIWRIENDLVGAINTTLKSTMR